MSRIEIWSKKVILSTVDVLTPGNPKSANFYKEITAFIHFFLLFRCNCERSNINVDVLGRPRRRRVYLSEIQIARAVTLIEEGHLRRQISRILNVIRAAINRTWLRYQIYAIVRRQPYLPRGRAISRREDRLIRLWATRVRVSTAATLQNELVETTETRISTQTTLNRLHEREFNPRRPANVSVQNSLCSRIMPVGI
jgi:transposase